MRRPIHGAAIAVSRKRDGATPPCLGRLAETTFAVAGSTLGGRVTRPRDGLSQGADTISPTPASRVRYVRRRGGFELGGARGTADEVVASSPGNLLAVLAHMDLLLAYDASDWRTSRNIARAHGTLPEDAIRTEQGRCHPTKGGNGKAACTRTGA